MPADAHDEVRSTDGQDEILRRMAAAENYNAWILDRALPYLNARVLDAGAGTGTFTALAARHADRVFAAEPEESFATALRRRFYDSQNVTVLRRPVEQLTVEELEGPVDTIMCLNVLEHIEADAAALAHLRALVAAHGRLLLLVPAHPTLFGSIDRTVAHVRRYTKTTLTATLAEGGFEPEVLRLVNPIGAIGWFISGRVLKRELIPQGPLAVFNRIVPMLRLLDRIEIPFGLSLWAVAAPRPPQAAT